MEQFRKRRARLAEEMGSGVLVLASGTVGLRNNDVHYPFRQDSDFYYLTGFTEPQAVLVVLAQGPKSILFLRKSDPERETWDGRRLGVAAAPSVLGVDEAYPIDELATRLPQLLLDQEQLVCSVRGAHGLDPAVDAAWKAARAQARHGHSYPTRLLDYAPFCHEARRIKSDDELVLMRRAIEITAEAHIAAMAAARPGAYEYEVDAVMRQIFRRSGSERVAYDPIVGAGENATILHYTENRSAMQAGDLLLIDAGCELGHYASDITRTFPVDGRFRPEQKAAYEVVLQAQLEAIESIRPGQTMEGMHQVAVRSLCRGLIELGVLTGTVDEAVENESYKPFYMHKTGHYLGMDVHDVGAYYWGGEPRGFEPGVVVTVEPGLYFGAQVPDSAAAFRGIGIRIEDDVLVTSDGCSVLSSMVPKSVLDVEQACRA